MTDAARPILRSYDEAWRRLVARLDGLQDEELFWEPVPGAWTVRRGASDAWEIDGGGGGPGPTPAPVTTIAWRVVHVGAGALGGFTGLRFGEGWPEITADMPTVAASVVPYLEARYRAWVDALAGLDDAGWTAPLGDAWGQYAPDSTIDLALHVLDEFVHHGAEIALLRDLYRERA
ncbi:MAG TPA: DinB family protein [Acidimicrobiales bacterium]|nr:DinB family protein [Acidimicrobiales bacterium]